jgi:hypothetical protein
VVGRPIWLTAGSSPNSYSGAGRPLAAIGGLDKVTRHWYLGQDESRVSSDVDRAGFVRDGRAHAWFASCRDEEARSPNTPSSSGRSLSDARSTMDRWLWFKRPPVLGEHQAALDRPCVREIGRRTKLCLNSDGNVAAIRFIQLRCVGSSAIPNSSRCVDRITAGGISSVPSSSTTSINVRAGTTFLGRLIISSNCAR